MQDVDNCQTICWKNTFFHNYAMRLQTVETHFTNAFLPSDIFWIAPSKEHPEWHENATKRTLNEH